MEIKNISGKVLLSVPVTDSAVIIEELMKQYSITLNWDAIENVELPLGAYIEHKNIKYSLLAPYQPQQRDEVTFEYKPEFQHPVMRWQYLPFLFYTYSNDTVVSKEPDWSLTDNAANFMAVLCDVIKEQTGEDWTYEVADNLPASASLSFSNKDIFSALNDIANAFETEWWFDYTNKVLYLSKASHGTEVALEVGNNISVPSVTQSKEGYYTRFLVFGSTRNIEQEYKGANTNSIVNKRLTLNPAKYPDGYIDIRNGLTNEEILTKTLVFDDIYPRSALTISDVKVRLMWRLDSNDEKIQIGTDASGKPVYDQYAIWYFKIPSLSFNKDMVISGKVLSVHFNDGPLQGREFELTYHDVAKDVETADGTSIRVDAGSFEINFIEEGSYIIPSITGLVPADGNKVTLFNILMPEEYKASAYEELEKAALKEIAKQSEDMSNYSFSSNPVEFFTSNPNLTVGRKVTYKNGDYSYSTRIIKLETQLDRPYEQKITIGNEQIKGNTQTLKEEVVSANQNIDLISAINESTQQLVQSYQRTQKALQESMAKWGNMWRLDAENNAVYTPLNMIVEGTLAMGSLGEGGSETPVAGLQKVSITIPNYDNPFVSDAAGNVTLPAYPTALKNPYALKINGVTYDGSKEISVNIEGGGGIADSVAWENVMGRPTKLSEFENDVPYATQKWVTDKGYLTSHQDISHLLSKQDAVTTYATIASLNAISDSVSGLRTEFDALNTLLNDDTSGVIDTWNEVVDFLNEYNGSQDLATILAGMNNDIANRVLVADFEKLEESVNGNYQSINILNGKVGTLEGYFTKGVANDSAKLGGQLPSYYATASALDTTNSNLSALTTRVGNAEGAITSIQNTYVDKASAQTITGVKTFQNGLQIGDAKLVWDSATNALKIIGSAYTTGTFGMGDLGEAGSGGGGAAGIVTVRVNGYDYNSVNGIVTLPAYPSLNGYATEQWVNNKGYITGINSSMVTTALGYTPYNSTNPSVYITSAALNGYATQSWVGANYLGLSGGTIEGVLYINTSIPEVRCCIDNNDMAIVGYRSGYGAWLYNDVCGSYLNIFDNGTPTYNGNTLLHSGNYSSYALPLSGGTMNLGYASLILEGAGDNKLIFNNTDGEKFQNIVFKESGVEYGQILASGEYLNISFPYLTVGWQHVLHSGNYSSYALPLTGGTVRGTLTPTPLAIDSTDAEQTYISIRRNGSSKSAFGYHSSWFGAFIYNFVPSSYIGIQDDATPYYYYNGSTHSLIHSGNIGSQVVEGINTHTSSAINAGGDIAKLNSYYEAGIFKISRFNGLGGLGTANSDGLIVNWPLDHAYGQQWYIDDESHIIQTRYVSGGSWSSFRTIAFTDSNVASATRLQTGRYLWGNYFNGEQDISDMIFLNSGGNGIYVHANGISYHDSSNGWVASIVGFDYYGNTILYHNFTVTGGATFGGDVKIGSSTLSWNTNGWLNINTNVVSDGTIGMFEITSSSDARLKDNIESVSAECSLAVVRQLRPTSWIWKKNSKKAYGLIAQEVSPIIPEAVDNLGDSLHLQYNQLHAFEIGAIQHIDSEVEKLKKDLKTAQEEIVVLKQQLNEYRQWQ